MRENANDKQKVELMGKTSTNGSASRTQRQKNCSNMSPSKCKQIITTACNLPYEMS